MADKSTDSGATIDLGASLAEARTALEAAESKIVSLRSERQRSLTDRTPDAAIGKIDAAIAAQERLAAMYRDRAAQLEAELRYEERDENAARRKAAAEVVEGRLEVLIRAVAEHQRNRAATKASEAAIETARQYVLADYPVDLPPPDSTDLYFDQREWRFPYQPREFDVVYADRIATFRLKLRAAVAEADLADRGVRA